MPLTEIDIERIEDLLFSEELSEDSLDYFGWHGLVTASTIGPKKMSTNTLARITFGDDQAPLSQEQQQQFEKYVDLASSDLLDALHHGNDIELPYEEEELLEEALESWCAGFMEGFFDKEKSWFTKGEEVTAELLLPIMALSGLFEEEEFQEIRRSDKLMQQFEEQLPDLIVDIYLFYNAD